MAISDPETVRVLVGAEPVDDTVFTTAYEAAEDYVGTRVKYPTDPDPDTGEVPEVPSGLVEAVILMTARYLARRNSPDGFIGLGELGVARVPTIDRDVDRLMAPWRRVVMA